MKIIRIITRMNIGGPTLHVALLTDIKYDNILIAGRIDENEGEMNLVPHIKINELHQKANLIEDTISFCKIYRIIKKEKPDVVHTHTMKAGVLGRIAAKLNKVPLIIHTYHGHVFHSYFSPLKSSIIILIERLLYKITDKVIVISERQEKEISKILVKVP